MTPSNDRQLEIIRIIRRLERMSVQDLATRFQISAVTIRKDLDELQNAGVLLRTHGGAILAEKPEQTVPIQHRLGHQQEVKAALALKAYEMIYDCQTVAVDAGTTMLEIARLLRRSNLRVVTNSLLAAQELAGRETGSLTLLGGSWRRESSCFIGPFGLDALKRVNIDIAFIGASGFAPNAGFTSQNGIEAQTKEAILERAGRRFIVADSSKYGRRAFTTFCGLDGLDGLITDDKLPAEALAELTSAGLTVIVARLKQQQPTGVTK